MKQRSIPMSIILTIITCGIYGIYWFVCITDETNRVSSRYGTSGGLALVFNLISCGIYGIYWGYKMGEALEEARAAHGEPSGSLPVLYLVLNIFGLQIVTYALIQSELNKYEIV
ncbi:DUF4234 domain-containing protein [Pseudoflavonifractor sp. 524-17]|uniref:DUF4234 domain-containing protein n=1 Tax=Pseudoflavonifractor sp. 524-17 TaxID=2304577 RepID=UPI00137B2480|nr:DUF4234 domain-containing protein [Pseudoflavonifractor sp. 524-17]NCE65156.1 DUF4234 domain-containing protein [Pseudoflavonifractor sp. 524-17]